MKMPDAKAAVQLDKVKRKRDVILEAQKEKKESPPCYMDGHLSSQKRGVGTQARWHCKRRLRCTCSIHRTRSSASQMTAARVMDVIARLLDCAGQAADSVPAHTQVKMEDAPRLLQIPVRMSRSGYVFHDTTGQNHSQGSKTQWFLSNEICTEPHLLPSCRKDN